MTKPLKNWMVPPARKPAKKIKTPLPDSTREEVRQKADRLIEQVIKPAHVSPPPLNAAFNYITDVTAKWHGSSFYFISTYACPGPTAMSPSFELSFARMEHVGNSRFALSFMRHTGKWIRMYSRLSVDECMDSIRADPWFQP